MTIIPFDAERQFELDELELTRRANDARPPTDWIKIGSCAAAIGVCALFWIGVCAVVPKVIDGTIALVTLVKAWV